MTPLEYVAKDFGTFETLFALQARFRGEHTAVICDWQSISYADLNALVDRIAAALQRDGVGRGSVAAICAASSIPYVAAFIGVLRSGAAVSPLSPSATPEQLCGMLVDSGAKVLFVDGAVAEALEPVRAGLGLTFVRLDHAEALEAWIGEGGGAPTDPQVTPSDPFNIIYSSGTTGTPKGIVQSHRMRWPHVVRADPPGYGPAAVTMISTPLYSNTTLVSVIPTLAGGGTMILMPKFDTGAFLRLAEKHRASHAMLVPVQYRRLMDDPSFDTFDLSSFVVKFATSAPFAAGLKAEVLRRWPGGLVEFYGMTEGGGSCMLLAHEHFDKLASVGQPMPGHDIRVIDSEGNEAPAGEVGEVVGFSPAIMSGYHNKPEQTREATWTAPDGRVFIRTGDIGRFDEEGFLTLMDRRKEMIISGGFNIYPSDLESVLAQHPEVGEVAVVGAPSDAWGETPVAFVVPRKDTAPDPDTLKEWANGKLGKMQRISEVRLIDSLPRLEIGKVEKKKLQASL